MNKISVIENYKVFYTHGIYKYDPISKEVDIFVRNTDSGCYEKKFIPLPLKLQDVLRKRWVKWFYVQKIMMWYNKYIKVGLLIEGHIEFTIAFCPEKHITVITICHPFLDTFSRKEGIKWVKMRMEWALKYPYKKERWWLYRLEK